MSRKIEVDQVFERYLPDNSVTLDDVEGAYREAVKDTHPDVGGSADDFKRVDSAAQKLREVMDENESYMIEARGLESETQDRVETPKQNSSNKISVSKCWKEGLEEANNHFDSDYEMVQYSNIGETGAFGRFEDSSNLSFAIEAQSLGSLFKYETTYFVDGRGEVGSYEKSAVNFELDDMEQYLQGVTALAVKNSEGIKLKNSL